MSPDRHYRVNVYLRFLYAARTGRWPYRVWKFVSIILADSDGFESPWIGP